MKNPSILPYSIFANGDVFALRFAELSEQAEFTLKSHEVGADREQWFIEWYDDLLVVCVEHLSESAWIEAIGTVSEEKLQIFYKHLICDYTNALKDLV